VAVIEDDNRLRRTVTQLLDANWAARSSARSAPVRRPSSRLPALAPDVVLVDINLPG
jgi:DNA-binding response OmpR family regulator